MKVFNSDSEKVIELQSRARVWMAATLLLVAVLIFQTFMVQRWRALAEDCLKTAEEWREMARRTATPDAFFDSDGNILDVPIYAVFTTDGEIKRVVALSSRPR